MRNPAQEPTPSTDPTTGPYGANNLAGVKGTTGNPLLVEVTISTRPRPWFRRWWGFLAVALITLVALTGIRALVSYLFPDLGEEVLLSMAVGFLTLTMARWITGYDR